MPVDPATLLSRHPLWVRYLLALAIFAVAVAARLAFLPVEAGVAYLTFYPGAAVTAFLCGVGPTLLFIVLSVLVGGYVFTPPHWAVPPASLALPASVAFSLSALAILLIVNYFQRRAASDVALHRRMDKALQQERALLRSVMDTTDVMLVYLDPGFDFVWVNHAYAATCQLAPEEMIGKNHFALYPHAENEAIFRRVRDTGEAVFHKDKPFEFPDQPERGVTYWDWSLAPDKNPAGQVVGLVFSLRETTAYVRARQAAREQEQKLALFVEGVPAGIAMFDREMRYLAASRRYLEDFGIAGADIVGRSHYEIFPEIPERWRAIHRRCLAGETVRCDEEPFRRADGRVDWVRWEVRPWRAGAGEIGGIILFTEDITARKRAEEALLAAKAEAESAYAAKSHFLAAVSHDLRQPLFALSLYVNSLGLKLAPADRGVLANLKDCVANLSGMLSDLLDLSRLEAGVIQPKVADFAVDALLSKIAATYRPAAQAKGLSLRLPSTAAIGRSDPVLFGRIIGNLVANAVRYTAQGAVLVGCRRRDGKRWVEVWDTGIGIPADKTAEIFEEFRQLGNEERNRAKGTGIGLAIVAKTAALLGLEVRVRSTPGKGSLFAVELPLGEAVAPVAERRYAHRPLRIALVEDNAEVATALTYALASIGHQVLAVASRPELLPLLDGTAPDIVISDYRLAGGESGIEVVAALRASFGEGLPAIIVTGDTDPAVIRLMAEQQITIQHKPVAFEALRAKIAELAG